MVITFIFLPDTTGLDLKEQERRWYFIRTGHPENYHGVAVHPKHLSRWERWRGAGKHYNPDLDYKQKIEEMRSEWEAEQEQKREEKESRERMRATEDDRDTLDDSIWSSDVSTYYRTTKSPFLAGKEKYVDGDHSSDEKLPRLGEVGH